MVTAKGETEEPVTFTLSGALAGARRCVPIAISGFAIGLVFGTLAGQAGLGAVEAASMSALVFSGAAQFVVLELWTAPLPVATIVLTTLVVGLRHLLMGAALGPVFSKLPRLKAYGSVFFMADEKWALTMGEFAKGRRDAGRRRVVDVPRLDRGYIRRGRPWRCGGRSFTLGARLRFHSCVSGSHHGDVEREIQHPPLDGGGRGRGGGAPLAARPVVHPARWTGGELCRGGTAWPLIPAPC